MNLFFLPSSSSKNNVLEDHITVRKEDVDQILSIDSQLVGADILGFCLEKIDVRELFSFLWCSTCSKFSFQPKCDVQKYSKFGPVVMWPDYLRKYNLMFANCSVFCNVWHVRSSILGQNVMFRMFDVRTFNVRSVRSLVFWCSFQD